MKSKNLLVISNNFPDKEDRYIGGIFVKDQVKYLKDYFENIYVVSPVAYGVDYLRKIKQEDYFFDNVRIYFPRYFNLPFFYFYGRCFWAKLENRAINSFLNKEKIKFDLIHAHYTWPSGAVAVKLKEAFNVPVVITEHTSRTVYKELKKKEYPGIWKLCDSIIRVNKRDIPLFVDSGVQANKIFYIPNGYDHNKFKPILMDEAKEKLGIKKDVKIILCIGYLEEVKGHEYLIKAIAKVIQKNKNVSCIIIGEGSLRSNLQKLINSLSLTDYVKLIGSKPHDQIPLWMNSCDLFVFPSLMESFGLVQIEAMACGKPVVAARNSGSEDIIANEKLGHLVEPKNSEQLAEKILLALNKEWDKEYILNYSEKFRYEEIAKEIFKVYEKVMNQK